MSTTNIPDSERYAKYLCSRQWGILRETVRKRCDGKCERCHINNMSHVHHLTYERKYEEKPEDLQGLCEGCHEFTHGKKNLDPITAYGKVEYYSAALSEILTNIPDSLWKSISKTGSITENLCWTHSILTDTLAHIGVTYTKAKNTDKYS